MAHRPYLAGRLIVWPPKIFVSALFTNIYQMEEFP